MRWLRGLLGAGWVGVLLACGGLPADPVLDPPPAATPPAASAELEAPYLLVLSPADGRCHWVLHSPSTGATETRWDAAGACPNEVLWGLGEDRIVTVDDGGVGSRPWLGDEPPRAVPMRKGPGERRGLWMSPSGLRAAYIVEAEVEEKGRRRVFRAGNFRVPTWKDEGGVQYGVRGTEVVEPGAGDRDVWLPPWGMDGLVAFFDLEDDGTWTRRAVLPTRYDAGDTPGISVGGALVERASTPSWTQLRSTCASGTDCYAPAAWADREGLVADLGGIQDGDSPGFLGAGTEEGGGWLFLVVFGDTPHGQGPVLWCADDECTERVPLEGVPDGQLSLDVRGGHLLVAEEYSNAAPRVYPAGEVTPVGTWPEGSVAAWLPDDGLPGLP